MSETAKKVFLAYGRRLALGSTIQEYWAGPSTGPINARWRDKPAQVLYDVVGEVVHLTAERDAALEEVERLRAALLIAEAALSDIGDAKRECGDTMAWCEARAAKAIPAVRAALEG